MKNTDMLTGFTLVEIMVIILILGLFIAIILPHLLGASNTTKQKICLNNKRLIGQAVEQYVIQNNIDDISGVSLDDIQSYIKGGVPECPCDSADDNDDYTLSSDEGGGISVSCIVDESHVPPYNTTG